jgi:hypothetical protein
MKISSWPEIGSDGDVLLTLYFPKGITGYDDDDDDDNDPAYSNINTAPARSVETHHITASSITPHRPINCNSQGFNSYLFLT